MKKLFIILAIAGTLAACNNSSEGTTTGDSTNITVDSNVNNMNNVDTSHLAIDSSTMKGDSIHKMGDTSNKK